MFHRVGLGVLVKLVAAIQELLKFLVHGSGRSGYTDDPRCRSSAATQGRKGGDRILGVAASCGLCRCWPCTVCTSDVHTVRGAVLQFCQVM